MHTACLTQDGSCSAGPLMGETKLEARSVSYGAQEEGVFQVPPDYVPDRVNHLICVSTRARGGAERRRRFLFGFFCLMKWTGAPGDRQEVDGGSPSR